MGYARTHSASLLTNPPLDFLSKGRSRIPDAGTSRHHTVTQRVLMHSIEFIKMNSTTVMSLFTSCFETTASTIRG